MKEVADVRFFAFPPCSFLFSPLVPYPSPSPPFPPYPPQGYQYTMLAPQPDGSTIFFSHSGPAPLPPSQSVAATVHAPNSDWTLRIKPGHGWVPDWRAPMLAAVAVASALAGLLVCAVLVSRRQSMWLLAEMAVTNAELAGEKKRMDVLLARQYDLLSCMLKEAGGAGGGGGGATGAGGGDAAGGQGRRSMEEQALGEW